VGLPGALETIAVEAGARGKFAVDVDGGALPTRTHDRLVFSAARELLANAAQHSAADRVQMRFLSDETRVVLEVSDNGRGFDPDLRLTAIQRGHIGLQSIAERVEAVGGSLTISSSPAGGTTARISLPVTLEATNPRPELLDPDSGAAELSRVGED
jgi:two-component system NarL family sensor kinase